MKLVKIYLASVLVSSLTTFSSDIYQPIIYIVYCGGPEGRDSPNVLRDNPNVLRDNPNVLRDNPNVLRNNPNVLHEGL